MKIDEFKKLEEKINGYNFNQNYKNVNSIMMLLSYFGNFTSIFLAYFFMSKVIEGAVGEGSTIFVFIASIIILAGIELLKRDIFNKFSILSLKDKKVTSLAMPLLITSLLLISASFYSSLSGAKEFSSKSDQIEMLKNDQIKEYSDSIHNLDEVRLENIENEIFSYKEDWKVKDNEQAVINSSLQDKGYLNRSEKDRNKQLTDEKNQLYNRIEKLEERLNNLKSERDKIIDNYKKEVSEITDGKKKDNSKNSIIFVILSTIIEIVILAGVFFNQYYEFRSYKEHRQKIEKDPNYQKWLLYDSLLDVIFTEDTKINQKLPSIKSIIDSCKVNDIIVLQKDITNFLKVLNSLGIIKASGSVKYITKNKEFSKEILKKSFNIE